MVDSRFSSTISARPWPAPCCSTSSVVLRGAQAYVGARRTSNQLRLCPGICRKVSRTGLTLL